MVKEEVPKDIESDAPAVDREATSDVDPYDSDEYNYTIRSSDSDDESETNNAATPSDSDNHNEGNAVANTSKGPAAKKRHFDAPSAEDVARPETKLQLKDRAVATLKDEKGNVVLNAIVIIKDVFWRDDDWVCNAQFCMNQGSYSTRTVGAGIATHTF
jgi:hypothetical protein